MLTWIRISILNADCFVVLSIGMFAGYEDLKFTLIVIYDWTIVQIRHESAEEKLVKMQ